MCSQTDTSAMKGRSVAHSAKGLPPFAEAPPLGLFEHPPVNPKTGKERNGVWAYKIAVSKEMAFLARDLRRRHAGLEAGPRAQAMKRMPYVGEYDVLDIVALDTVDLPVILPTGYEDYLYWLDGSKPLARFVFTNMPEEVAWEGGELHLRQSRFCWYETKKGVLHAHYYTPGAHRLVALEEPQPDTPF
jgi:hypothetical protein